MQWADGGDLGFTADFKERLVAFAPNGIFKAERKGGYEYFQ
jgi:hypothetical protein